MLLSAVSPASSPSSVNANAVAEWHRGAGDGKSLRHWLDAGDGSEGKAEGTTLTPPGKADGVSAATQVTPSLKGNHASGALQLSPTDKATTHPSRAPNSEPPRTRPTILIGSSPPPRPSRRDKTPPSTSPPPVPHNPVAASPSQTPPFQTPFPSLSPSPPPSAHSVSRPWASSPNPSPPPLPLGESTPPRSPPDVEYGGWGVSALDKAGGIGGGRLDESGGGRLVGEADGRVTGTVPLSSLRGGGGGGVSPAMRRAVVEAVLVSESPEAEKGGGGKMLAREIRGGLVKGKKAPGTRELAVDLLELYDV